jgi:CubicO group peptidase (beta-lactamase class C family)
MASSIAATLRGGGLAPTRERLPHRLSSCLTLGLRGLAVTLALCGLAQLAGPAGAVAAEAVFPGKTWATKAPAEVGLDAAKLAAMSDFIGGRGCVVRHGYLVYRWGDISRRADVASAAKPFYSFLLFKALEDGRIPSLDEKVVRWQPRLATINAQLDHKDRLITWRHLANQIACYGLTERPGTAFDYNDWQMAFFWDTLFLQVYGATYATVDAKVFHPLLTDPIGCQDNPTLMAFTARDRPGRVGVSVRDFARFGLLFLRQGNWRGSQLLRPATAQMAVTSALPNTIPRAGDQAAEMIPGQRSIGSTRVPDNQTDHFGSYSWLWWTNGVDRHGTRMLPAAPTDLYGAFGHGGPRAMWVIPSLDIVVSYNDASMNRWVSGETNQTNEATRLLVDAVVKPK